MNIVLIGYRGTGKSSVAKEMAHRLAWHMVSTDDVIQKRAGLTIPQIVERFGWEGFRDLESAVVSEVARGDGQVVDTGGGVILRPENVQALKREGVFIWLRAEVQTIQERMQGGAGRPSLTGDKNSIDEVKDVLKKRTPLYQAAADLSIDTDGKTIHAICDQIMEWLMNSYDLSKRHTLPHG